MTACLFEVTCTDGGWVRPEARWPEVSIDIPVGAMRAYEFDAKVKEGKRSTSSPNASTAHITV